MTHELLLVMDFGSQYGQLIARRARESGVYSEFVSHYESASSIRGRHARGIILSGGPASVHREGAPKCDPELLRLGIPVLGICYGMQLAASVLGGKVSPAPRREYGRTICRLDTSAPLFKGLPEEITVWMSHGDQVVSVSGDFEPIGATENCRFAAVKHAQLPVYGVQFHPEVAHTERGAQILENFLKNVCGFRGDWQMSSFVAEAVAGIRERVGRDGVVCGLSGGVDSFVTAMLVWRAVGEQLTSVFVDHGLLRAGEREEVAATFGRHLKGHLRVVDARQRFLSALRHVTEPEEKRRIIGREFAKVFEHEAKSIEGVRYLAQGTLFPDVIESTSAHGGPTSVIKTHHNVGGLPVDLPFELIEPLRMLFKDEVRRVAKELGLPDSVVWRQPFPGPGLAIRILGEVTEERLNLVREADRIVLDEIRKAGLAEQVWQSFAVLLPVSSTGVMGDERTYENVVAIRVVESTDAMTADWARLSDDLLAGISGRITNEVRGVNRVVYDITSKPPSTIEWE